MDRVEEIVARSAKKLGLILVEFEIKNGNIEAVVYSTEHNVTIDELELLTEEIQHELAEVGLDTVYGVNLSSPGLDRILKTDKELDIFQGRLVKVSYFDEDKIVVRKGILEGKSGSDILLNCEEGKQSIPFNKVTSVQLWDKIFEKRRR